MAEEEDIVWLTNFGVTSVNPEDIERDVLEEARKNADKVNEDGENSGEEATDKPESIDPSSMSRVKLYNKLKAVEFEIDAVAVTVGQVKDASRNEDCAYDGNDCEGEDKGLVSSSDLNLQHALAVDRLRCLKKTRRQLKKELSDSCEDMNGVIFDLVKEESVPKRKLKAVQKSSQHVGKRVRTVAFNEDSDFDAVLDAASGGFVETEKDQLIRKGILTPFHRLRGFERRIQQSEPSNRHNEAEVEDEIKDVDSVSLSRVLRSMSEAAQARPTTKLLGSEALPKLAAPTQPFRRLRKHMKIPESLEEQSKKSRKSKEKKRPLPDKRWRRLLAIEEKDMEIGNNLITSTIEEERLDDAEDVIDDDLPFTTLEGGLKFPDSMFDQLFDYQKVGVQWLWELHCQRAGGIIGDEMGLGKTVQVLSFLGALHFSNMYKPSIVVCPATLLRQWKREAQKWYPSFHVEILHDSAHDSINKNKRAKSNDSDHESEDLSDSDYEENLSTNASKWDSLIKRVLRSESGLLITTYEQLRLVGDKLLNVEWGYAILDEGHRIRNPNAEITLVCKQIQTVHRIIMTGAPIQNKLTELWSLFDFVFPGKLGVLPVFEAEFAVPISVGGYANASPLQVSTAYRCAVVLRDLIMPYLLRRMKSDVNAHLPKKTEHVLFCSLTSEQRSVYRSFLASSEVEQILDGRKNSLYGIDVMRKICNHPDLLEREHSFQNPDYGKLERSAKMKVVDQVLKVWKEQGHRVLLFAQTQQMLDILESFLVAGGYNYRRMDGVTPVKQRMALIDEFNNSEDVFIFILTTKVGGLGTNLTGADRVIIFDPDWNPSTDMQARERAWRIGQKKDVTVYRLITRGTIEEKVYHRQIYKHFLTNKILQNPQQKRFFKARDMKDLFILNEDGESGSTETSNIFSQLSDNVNVVGAQRDEQDNHKLNDASTSRTNDRKKKVEGGTPPKRKGKEKADHNDGNMDKETNILKSLFDAQGIHSAVNHDIIMNAHEEEKMRLEEQASRVAQRAAEALRMSRMCRSGERISVPTWTGKSGSAGAPSSVNRKFGASINTKLMNRSKSSDELSQNGAGSLNGYAAGTSTGKALSSTELLAQIRGNQARALGAGLEHQSGSASSSTLTTKSVNLDSSSSGQKCSRLQPEILIRQICTFMQQRGGTSTSGSIVEHFRNRIPADDLPLFKNLLKEIAVLEKASDGSRWVLKSEYQQQ